MINSLQKLLLFKFLITFSKLEISVEMQELFVNAVGKVAEDEKHHPDISLGYGYCLIMIHTHAISSLSINDFILASKIDDINLES